MKLASDWIAKGRIVDYYLNPSNPCEECGSWKGHLYWCLEAEGENDGGN